MTTETDLLPLPHELAHLTSVEERRVEAYARANVAHATAPLQAEIEALRAEVDRLRGYVREAAERLEQWREAIELLETVDDFNGKLADIKSQPRPIQQLFASAAKAKGLDFDKAAGKYVQAQDEAA